MWPWEHLAFGYACLSLFSRARWGEAPSCGPAVAVAFGSVLPDLVDKPLSWSLGLFPAGYSVAHSAFVAAPLASLALALAARARRWRVGVAFVVGYWLHLLADVFNPLRSGGGLAVHKVLWPLVALPPYETDLGLAARTGIYLRRWVAGGASSDLVLALGAYAAVHFAVFALWLYDGAPPARRLLERLAGARRS